MIYYWLKNCALQEIPNPRKPISDHPYANPTDAVTPAPTTQQIQVHQPIVHPQHQQPHVQPQPQVHVIQHKPSEDTAKDSERVNTEHSYGTRQRLASIREGDHAYSTKMPDDPNQILAIVEAVEAIEASEIQDKLRGSAKRKASLKSSIAAANSNSDRNVENSKPLKRLILGNKYTCDLCGKTCEYSI